MSDSNYPSGGSLAELEDVLNDAAGELRKAEQVALQQIESRRARASLYEQAEETSDEELRSRFTSLPKGN